jgi:hypothetical protein
MSTYNFLDADVLNLVRATHRPAELPVTSAIPPVGVISPVTLALICDADHEPWPCAAITQLRAFSAANPPPPPPPPLGGGGIPIPPPRGGSGSRQGGTG